MMKVVQEYAKILKETQGERRRRWKQRFAYVGRDEAIPKGAHANYKANKCAKC